MPVAGFVLVDGLTGPTLVLLVLVAATAYLVAELGGRYLNYLLAKQAVRRCDPSRLPELVAAVTGNPPPGTRPPNGK
jgi:hypothetical protein